MDKNAKKKKAETVNQSFEFIHTLKHTTDDTYCTISFY